MQLHYESRGIPMELKCVEKRGKRRTLAPVPIDGNFPIAPSKHLIGGIFIIGSRSEGIFMKNFSVAVANCDRPNLTIDSMRAHLSGFRRKIIPDTSLASSPYFYGPETHKHHRKFFSCYFKPFYDVYVNMSCRYRYIAQASLMSYADECSVIILSSFLSEWMNGVVRLLRNKHHPSLETKTGVAYCSLGIWVAFHASQTVFRSLSSSLMNKKAWRKAASTVSSAISNVTCT